MFTNIHDSIKNIRVLDHCESCLSDHFGISFDINFSVRRKKRTIKKVYNYSQANWKELNYDLKRIDWNNVIGSIDTHSAWSVFKNILLSVSATSTFLKGMLRENFNLRGMTLTVTRS